MTKEMEDFIGVYRVINAMGPAIDDHRWDDFAALFADDAAVHHNVLGDQIGIGNVVSGMRGIAAKRITTNYFVGNIRIFPSEGETVHAECDFHLTMLHPGEGEDPSVFTAGYRFAANSRQLHGRWRIVELTPAERWVDPGMARFINQRKAALKA
ncbi:MAG: nuclear transport factor 2 family protein [Steroidobacteraceae bacterium]